jgi:hypothetical protein
MMSVGKEMEKDLLWWAFILPRWNGKRKMQSITDTIEDIRLHTDASKFGCGGAWGTEFFQIVWDNEQMGQQYKVPQEIKDLVKSYELEKFAINVKELFGVVTAAVTWGPRWKNKNVCFYCDNLGDVYAVMRGGSKNAQIMHLLRVLTLSAALHGYSFTMSHIAGKLNVVADAISREHVDEFLEKFDSYHQVQPTLPPHFADANWEMAMMRQIESALMEED